MRADISAHSQRQMRMWHLRFRGRVADYFTCTSKLVLAQATSTEAANERTRDAQNSLATSGSVAQLIAGELARARPMQP